jgi:acetyl esterase/lipase
MTPLRFLFGWIALLFGLLVVVPAPTVLLFQLKVGATELGHWLVLLPLSIILIGRRRNRLDSASVMMGIVAALLFISTSARAWFFSPDAAGKMRAAFPNSSQNTGAKPFSLGRLWSLGGPAPRRPQTMTYSEAAGGLELDFYAAEREAAAACIIMLHTGGWDNGTRREFLQLNEHLAARGYAVAAIDYRLAPIHPWPAQMEDTIAAIRYLEDRAEELGVDPKKFVLMGRSAGGQIAEAVSVTGKQPGVVGCIALYAPADLHFAFKYADKKDILDSDKLLRQYMGGTPEEKKQNYDSASPYLQVNPNTPPTLLIHGASDELVWVKQSERYAARLKEQGVKHVFLRLPWATHALDYSWNSPGGQLTTWAVEQFLFNVTD